ncbi:hypothetical protein [Alkalilacustris brevis]|uniref:hypothetical protein n=1 Tax=Alkalilacustris brevis TaxID=2026338 RepID=UPI000E0DA557|nr:hypothetical protein [Alkalilacustris brevis]
MALPVIPIAGIGVVALAGYLAARSVVCGRIDQRTEDAMDELPEGLSGVHAPEREQANGAWRYRRVIRWGAEGRGVEVDLALLGRLRLRRVPGA